MKNTLTTLSFPLFLFAAAILDAQTPQTLSVDKNPLNFSVQVGGSAVTQTLNVIGSGGFTTFPSTSPPGTSWLRVNPVNGSAPTALTVTADPSGLPAGPYVGDLFIFSTNPAALAVDVKVNLTVSTISVSPTSLTFAFQMGATPPATQSLTLSGPATYNAVATASGGNWLLLSTGGIAAGTAISGGASPGTITVSVSPTVLAALTPATYNGSITITPTSGASNGPITIPVTLTVSAAPPVTVSPNSVSLAFQTTGGSNNLAQQTVTLSTNGIQGVPYTLALFFDNNPAGRIFFTVAPGRIGTIPANGSAQLTFAYDTTTNLPAIPQPGQSGCTSSGCTYTGKATLLTPGGTPTQQDIPVTLLVSASPLLSLSANTLSFTYQIGANGPAAQNVTVNSTSGSTALTLAATTANNSSNWLSVPASATAGTAFPVTVNPASLAPGNYTGTITVTASGAANSPQQITVNLKVTNDPVIVAIANGCSTASLPCPLIFPSQTGQAPAPAQLVRVTSSTGTPLNYSTTTSGTTCGNNWLVVSGATSGSTDGIFSVAVNPASIAPGTKCDGTVSIAATNPTTGAAAPNSPLQIPATLYVSSTPLLVFGPGALTLSGNLNGQPTSPQTITLASTSVTDLVSYSVTSSMENNGNWLLVGPPSGTAGANGSTLTVVAVPTNLSAGIYKGTITITATGPDGNPVADSPVTIPVIFQVNAGTISANATSLNFSQLAGGAAPATQSITVSGTPNSINFAVSASADNGGTWLTVAGVAVTTPGTVQVSASAGSLPVGSYTGKVTITAATPPGATGSPISIPVTLNVVAAQTLTASPTNVNFTYTTGAPTPANQTVALTSTGGTAPFTVKVDQGTGTWLTVTPTSGNTQANTPTSLTFAANPTGLAAGKPYTATVTISSSAALNPTTVTVTLTVSTPIPPLVTSVNNAASYATGGVSPGENIVIFGTGIGPTQLAAGTVTNGVWDKVAGNTQVLFDGVAAPVIYARADVTSVMVPYGVAGRQSTTIVVTYQGVQSSPLVYNVVQAAPGIYSQNQSGTGPGAILNQDNSVNGPANPAAKGSAVAVYMTGEGQTNPASTDGALATALNHPQLVVSATVAGIPANVEYSGSAPGIIYGVIQVNVRLPANTPTGPQPIVIRLGTSATAVSFSTQAGLTVQVQ